MKKLKSISIEIIIFVLAILGLKFPIVMNLVVCGVSIFLIVSLGFIISLTLMIFLYGVDYAVNEVDNDNTETNKFDWGVLIQTITMTVFVFSGHIIAALSIFALEFCAFIIHELRKISKKNKKIG